MTMLAADQTSEEACSTSNGQFAFGLPNEAIGHFIQQDLDGVQRAIAVRRQVFDLFGQGGPPSRFQASIQLAH
jgi:hypothetical protein